MTEEGTNVTVTIGGIPLRVPVSDTPDHTRALAELVNRKLHEIEAQSTRIDTQAFALLTAMSFAAELSTLKHQQAQDEREILLALSSILDNIREILEQVDQAPDTQ